MPTFKVYHKIEPNWTDKVEEPFGDHYEHVADVEAKDIDDVYRLTNHIDEPWNLNKEVTAKKTRVRSTSVGDIIIKPDGTKHVCAPFGWNEVAI